MTDAESLGTALLLLTSIDGRQARRRRWRFAGADGLIGVATGSGVMRGYDRPGDDAHALTGPGSTLTALSPLARIVSTPPSRGQ